MTERMLRGQLTAGQVSLIVQLCELAGKVQGAASFVALGNLLAALETFEPEKEQGDGDDIRGR